MTHYILFIILNGVITTQEFTTEARCVDAKETLKVNLPMSGIGTGEAVGFQLMCFPK